MWRKKSFLQEKIFYKIFLHLPYIISYVKYYIRTVCIFRINYFILIISIRELIIFKSLPLSHKTKIKFFTPHTTTPHFGKSLGKIFRNTHTHIPPPFSLYFVSFFFFWNVNAFFPFPLIINI